MRSAILALLVAATPAVAGAQTPVFAPAPAPAPTPASMPPAPQPEPVAFAALPLASALERAVAASPDVAAADAVVRENQAALAAARAARGPALVGGYLEAPQGGGVGDVISQRLTSVGVQTTVGDALGYGPLVASASAALQSAQLSYAAASRSERVKTVGLYYDALKAHAIALARSEALRTAQQQRDAAQIRVSAGDAPRLDLVRASVAVARATAASETAAATDANAAEALLAETGAPVSLQQTVDQPVDVAGDVAPADAARAAVAHRADLAAADATTVSARAAAAAAHRLTFPAVTLGVGYEAGVDSGVKVHGPTITVNVSVPLNGAASALARQKDAVVAEDAAKAQALRRQIALDIAASTRNLAAARRATAATREARAQALAELRATELGYRSGASSSLELTSARDTYGQAVVDELSSLYDELKARTTLDLEIAS